MLRRIALAKTDVSQEGIASIIRVISIFKLGTTLPVTSNRSTLTFLHSVLRSLVNANANVVPSSQILITVLMEAIRTSETSVLTRATRRTIPEDGILRVSFEITVLFVKYKTVMTELWLWEGYIDSRSVRIRDPCTGTLKYVSASL
jgi:hypothetical protein